MKLLDRRIAVLAVGLGLPGEGRHDPFLGLFLLLGNLVRVNAILAGQLGQGLLSQQRFRAIRVLHSALKPQLIWRCSSLLRLLYVHLGSWSSFARPPLHAAQIRGQAVRRAGGGQDGQVHFLDLLHAKGELAPSSYHFLEQLVLHGLFADCLPERPFLESIALEAKTDPANRSACAGRHPSYRLTISLPSPGSN